MQKNENSDENIDWSLTTWEGSRREMLRRWAELPLERIFAALEEMHAFNEALNNSQSQPGRAVQTHQAKYDSASNKS